jgi:predicted metal-binding protein
MIYRLPRFVRASLCSIIVLTAVDVLAAEILDPRNANCLSCHAKEMPGIFNQWKHSRHAQVGVGCIDCHGAAKADLDAFEHHEELIATLVTPKDCGGCHKRIAAEVQRSHHATAGTILDSADSYLAHAAGGHPVAIAGCESCHGGKVEIDPDSPNKLSANSWPNSGVGRINPDGSLGACTACHTRHSFDKAQARRPEACSKCHLGPDHPQKEAYAASKHGNAYYTNVDKMNLESKDWVVGVDYWVAPTCATCHMSATRNQPVTHDVGARISWNLRPPVSKRQENWEQKRLNMLDTCGACHGDRFAKGFYRQFDAVVRLYDEKFGIPARDIMDLIRKKGLLESPAEFSNDIEWIYWELWHHEGRTVRHGASKMAPDYTWWHGMYEVIQSFYFHFIPAARAFGDPDVNAKIDEVLADPKHQWLSRNTDAIKKDIKQGDLQKIYEGLFDEP